MIAAKEYFPQLAPAEYLAWEIIRYIAGDLIELRSINLTFPIEQVFEGITFTPVPEN
jgi:hypothetical protein